MAGNRPANDWALAAERVAIKLITTGNIFALVALVMIIGFFWKLSSDDLRSVVTSILGAAWLAALGWVLFGFSVGVAVVIVRAQEKFYCREMDRICKVRDQLMQGRFDLEIPSSSDTSKP